MVNNRNSQNWGGWDFLGQSKCLVVKILEVVFLSDESHRLVLKIVILGAIVVIHRSARKPEARLSASVNWPDCA
jgi:hypothetical protein